MSQAQVGRMYDLVDVIKEYLSYHAIPGECEVLDNRIIITIEEEA